MADRFQAPSIKVEIVYASEQRQEQRTIDLPAGSTVAQAIKACGTVEWLADGGVDLTLLGIFARRVTSDHVLTHGDRVEIYRPLTRDPKQARRKRARHL